MEVELSALHGSTNAFEDRNDFLHLLLGIVSVARTVTELFGGGPNAVRPAVPSSRQAAGTSQPPGNLLR
jgi:hypothetical protein